MAKSINDVTFSSNPEKRVIFIPSRKSSDPMRERYINPLTDFGFKKLFGTYEESLKYYRDIKNVVDTSREEGFSDGMEQGIERGIEKRNTEIAKELKKNNVSIELIMRSTGLSEEEIKKL